MKRTFSLLVALSVMILLLPTAALTQEEPEITLRVLGGVWTGMLQGVQNNPVADELAKRTGVRLDLNAAAAGSLEEMLTLQLASDNLMDVITDVDTGAIERAGKLLDLEPLIDEYGPNIQAKYGSLFPIWRFNALDDGKIYKLYNLTCVDIERQAASETTLGIGIRYDLLKELGLPAIQSTDDWYEVMVQMKERFPTVDGNDAYPFATFLGEDWSVYWSLLTPFSCGQGLYERCSTYYLDDGTNIVLSSREDTDVYWQAMAFYNRAYREGLFDPQSFEMNFDQLADKLKSGRVYSYATFADMSDGAEVFWAGNEGTAERTFAFPDIKTAGYTGKTIWDLSSGEGAGSKILGITTANKHPEKTMQFFDFLASDEGQLLCGRGVEGLHYTLAEDGAIVMNEDTMNSLKTDDSFLAASGIGSYRFLAQKDAVNAPGQAMWWFLDPAVLQEKYSPAQKEAYAWLGQALKGDTSVLESKDLKPLVWSNSISLPEDVEQIINQVSVALVNTCPKAILAESDDAFEAVKQAHFTEMDKLGYDKLVSFMQEEYQKNLPFMQSLEAK